MRIRRCIAAVLMAGTLAAGSLGASSAMAHTANAPAVTVPAGMNKAQFCDRATGFFTWWDQAAAAAISRLQDAISQAKAAGNTAGAAKLQDVLTRGQGWLAAITQFENRVKTFCGATPAT
jgi:hypothetical protein